MLNQGTQLGPYEVLSPLGAGGMGEVYRAKDGRLGREVAVKVLPRTLATDPDRLRRFEQEARAAGMLNYPNILAIYDIGTHDGSPYLVSELLEGETLRDRLGGKPLSVRKAVDYGQQIARGLAAAHEKGITHRDLKPENIFVTKDGRIKIFDFGLAKLTRPETPRAGGNQDSTTLAEHTTPGAILGTVGYMSPEQVRGQSADHRSDIFSFGAIMYEMVSGHRAFRRETPAETMTAILKEDPPDLSATVANLPPALDRMVRHCLEKSPDERFQSARDMAYDLDALSSVSGSTTTAAVALTQTERAAAARPVTSRAKLVLVPTAAALVMLAAGLFFGQRLGKTTPPSFHAVTFRRGTIRAARFAPDGLTIVYGAKWDGNPIELYSTRPESSESRTLGYPGADILSISPSGEMAISLKEHSAGPFSFAGTLARAALAGGASREIQEEVEQADWAPSGGNLAIVRSANGREQIEFPAGKVVYETAGWISNPRVSPKSDMVAFVDHPATGDDGGSVAVVDASAKKKTLSSGWISALGLAWGAGGDEVWFTATREGSGRALHAVTLGGKERLVARAPGTLTLQDISRDGRALIAHDNQRMGMIALAPGETRERELAWLDWSLPADISPDGRTVLFVEAGEGGGATYGLYIRKTDGSPAVRIGDGAGAGFSPDGKWALAITSTSSAPQLVLYPTGAGNPRPLKRDDINYVGATFLPDGKRILIAGNEPGHAARVWVGDISGGKPRPITPEGAVSNSLESVSPDGKFLVARNPDGKFAMYPVDGGEPRPIAGLEEGEQPSQWSGDGRSLYVSRRSVLPRRVYRLDLATGHKEFWREFSPSDTAGLDGVSGLRVTPDGKAYVYAYLRLLSVLYLVEGLK
ncbi:MAG: protein kinase [Acidobacteriia bacterium]|nr:protein kinase [Terriglobia bacterium]